LEKIPVLEGFELPGGKGRSEILGFMDQTALCLNKQQFFAAAIS